MRSVILKVGWDMRRALGRRSGRVVLVLAVVSAAIIIANLATAAATAQAPTVGAPDVSLVAPADVQLHVGETATLDGGALQVTLTQVAEDSRCPEHAECVWSGQAVVMLHVVVDGVDQGEAQAAMFPGAELHSRPNMDATADRYVLALTDLQPYRQMDKSQPLDQRVAMIHV